TGCPPKYPKCSNDKDCHEKEYCVNGQCQQCRSDGDCPGGKCASGRCESAPVQPSACSDDKQCPAGQSCIDGKCKPCTSDEQLGVSTDMKINARGEMDATGKDEAGWAKDRRVDVAW